MFISSLALSSNLVLFLGLIALLFVMASNPLFDKKQTRLFIIAICVNLIALFAISMDYTFSVSGIAEMYVYRRFTSFLNFSLSPVIPFLLYLIFQQGRIKLWIYAPLVLNIILCLFSMFEKIIFFISERNTYGRGPLFILPITTSFFYILMLIINPASSHAQKQKKERVFLLGVIAILVLSMFFEIVFGLFFLTWNASALSIILYYLMLNIHYFSLDALTGVSSRLMYNHTLTRIRGGYECIIAIIDINGFKKINDSQGHEAGDLCLIKFSKILTRAFAKTATVYRIGGDEFALITRSVDEQKFTQCLSLAKKECEAAEISFACGISVYSLDKDLQDVLAGADKAMYEDKALAKEMC